MIRLDTVNRSLTLVLGGAQATAPLQIVVSYSDQTSSTYLGSTQLTNSNGTTAVTICSAPIASVIRDIDMVTVLNTDSVSQVVTIQLLDTATTYKIITVTLLIGDKLTYTHGSAWQVLDNLGNVKSIVLSTTGVNSFSGGSTGLTPATATTGAVTLGGTLAVASGGTGTASPALVAGTNVTITGTWPNQTINSTNTGGTVTSVAALTLGTTGTDVSSTVANSTTTPVITLNLPTASATNRGALSAADWTTFNGKGSGTVTSVSGTTGRITSTGGTTPVLDLTSGIATPGTTGSTALIPVVTIDTYGRVTSITTAANPQGTVTSVTGTAPVVSSGGATPAISMAAATSSVNGYLTSADWVTFNSKGSGSVTSVAATVPSFLSVAGSPITTSGTLAISYSGTALPPANGGTGIANNAASTLTISGSFGTTLTVSATTAVTLPTSGTLATLAGSETFTNKTLTNPTVTNYVETLQAVGTVGASSTLALTTGTVLTATLTASTPCTFTMPTATAGKSFILILTQASSGMTTATFTGVKWPAGTAPTITATASAVDIISFVANGSVWYGNYVQAFA